MHRTAAELFAPTAVATAGFVTNTGFVTNKDGPITRFGASASLGIGARPCHDTALVAHALAKGEDNRP